MNELVIMKNERAVTSTTNVAKNFKREHHNVMKSVEALKKDVVNFNEMFFETTEPDSYNRERKVYLMNRDGFTLLAMGFTGKRAMEFKLKYIEAFNDMEKKRFGEAIEWIEEWQPDTTTRMEIKAANTQLTIVDGGSL